MASHIQEKHRNFDLFYLNHSLVIQTMKNYSETTLQKEVIVFEFNLQATLINGTVDEFFDSIKNKALRSKDKIFILIVDTGIQDESGSILRKFEKLNLDNLKLFIERSSLKDENLSNIFEMNLI